MLAEQAIDTKLSPLTVNESVEAALARMDKYKLDSFPVVDPDSGKLLGQVNRTSMGNESDKVHLSDLELDEGIKIYRYQHLFEAARLMLQYELRFVSVVDSEMVFAGVIHKQKVLESLTGMLNLAAFGSVITVELNKRDFTLAEIVHLIEQEEAKILGLTVETPSNKRDNFKVSIKINLQNTDRVTSALNRYGYTVTTEDRNEVFGVDLESRADELLKYLDM